MSEDVEEPELKPEFVDRMKKRQEEEPVKIKNLRKHFGLESDERH